MQRGIWLNCCFKYIFETASSSVKKTHFFRSGGRKLSRNMETVQPNQKIFFSFGISMKICFKNTAKPYPNQKKLKYEQVCYYTYPCSDLHLEIIWITNGLKHFKLKF